MLNIWSDIPGCVSDLTDGWASASSAATDDYSCDRETVKKKWDTQRAGVKQWRPVFNKRQISSRVDLQSVYLWCCSWHQRYQHLPSYQQHLSSLLPPLTLLFSLSVSDVCHFGHTLKQTCAHINRSWQVEENLLEVKLNSGVMFVWRSRS